MTWDIQNNSAKRLAAALISIFAIASFCGLPACALADKDEWILEQNSDELGPTTVHVSYDAVKVVNADSGYEVLAKAPDWTVHCYRRKEKLEWIGDMPNFSGAMINSPFREASTSSTKVFPISKGVMKGLKYTRYSENKQSLKVVYGADDLAISRRASDFLARCNQLPDCAKVPIYSTDMRGQEHSVAHTRESWVAPDLGKDIRTGLVIQLTTRSWKRVPYNTADFQPPQGFKRVTRVADAAFSESKKKGFAEVFDSMGFASDQADQNGPPHGKTAAQASGTKGSRKQP